MNGQLEIHKPEMSGEVVPVGGADDTLLRLIERVVTLPNVDVAKIEKLFDFRERWEKNQARKAFDAAVSAAKAEIPVVIANKTGHNNKRYADFAAFARAVDPVIARHGLSYRFRTIQEDRISVTCILSHRDGHSEESTLSGPADKTGSKNDIQAIGSTLTYLQRYALRQVLGLAASDDDDAKAAGAGETISDEQVKEISDLLIETKSNLALFLKAVKLDSLTEIHVDKFEAAKKLIRDTAAKRAEREAAQKVAS